MSSQRHFAILGNEWDAPKVAVPKRKQATAISEHRAMAVADALGAEKREAIQRAARERAAEIMRDWEGRR